MRIDRVARTAAEMLIGVPVGFAAGCIFFTSLHLYAIRIQESNNIDITIDQWPAFEHLRPENSENIYRSGDKTAMEVFLKVKIHCWIMTQSNDHYTKAITVRNTWARHCNSFIFISNQTDPMLPSLKVNVSDGRDFLWGKTKRGFEQAYDEHIAEPSPSAADWFLKADDDTFLILENLRAMLRNFSAEQPVYFGCKFKLYAPKGYMSGGAGYVLSREALRRFVEDGSRGGLCEQSDKAAEDVEMGVCLHSLGVTPLDTRDAGGALRFSPFPPKYSVIPRYMPPWFWVHQLIAEPLRSGLACCSDGAVSFHYIPSQYMRLLYFLTYVLRLHRTARPPSDVSQLDNVTYIMKGDWLQRI